MDIFLVAAAIPATLLGTATGAFFTLKRSVFFVLTLLVLYLFYVVCLNALTPLSNLIAHATDNLSDPTGYLPSVLAFVIILLITTLPMIPLFMRLNMLLDRYAGNGVVLGGFFGAIVSLGLTFVFGTVIVLGFMTALFFLNFSIYTHRLRSDRARIIKPLKGMEAVHSKQLRQEVRLAIRGRSQPTTTRDPRL